MFLQLVCSATPAEAGIRLLPNTVFGAIGSVGAGLLIRTTERYYALTLGGALLVLPSFVGMYFLGVGSADSWTWVVMVSAFC